MIMPWNPVDKMDRKTNGSFSGTCGGKILVEK
jgi:hypothetical protein